MWNWRFFPSVRFFRGIVAVVSSMAHIAGTLYAVNELWIYVANDGVFCDYLHGLYFHFSEVVLEGVGMLFGLVYVLA